MLPAGLEPARSRTPIELKSIALDQLGHSSFICCVAFYRPLPHTGLQPTAYLTIIIHAVATLRGHAVPYDPLLFHYFFVLFFGVVNFHLATLIYSASSLSPFHLYIRHFTTLNLKGIVFCQAGLSLFFNIVFFIAFFYRFLIPFAQYNNIVYIFSYHFFHNHQLFF